MTTKYQNQAAAIVAAQIEQLRAVLGEVNARLTPATSDLRQIARTIDELAVRSGRSENAIVQRQLKQLRDRQAALDGEVLSLQTSARSIEQLIRQTEMSSATLRDDTAQADPWNMALKAQIIQGREDERTRLAREVHDGPAQVLAHVLLGLEHSLTLAHQQNTDRLIELLKQLRDSSRGGLHEVRRFIADLRPPALEHQGLDAAIKELCARFTAGGAISVRSEGMALPRLAPEQEIVLYRITQEALNNAVKHARNANVVVHYGAFKGQIILIVRDDGPGFDLRSVAARTKGKHWGLASMRERAELVGAQFAAQSAPGQGTEIRVTLALESNGF
jgi:two-component system, NarL family, sensor histidine kinase DegS